jgi:hypothetical protein
MWVVSLLYCGYGGVNAEYPSELRRHTLPRGNNMDDEYDGPNGELDIVKNASVMLAHACNDRRLRDELPSVRLICFTSLHVRLKDVSVAIYNTVYLT